MSTTSQSEPQAVKKDPTRGEGMLASVAAQREAEANRVPVPLPAAPSADRAALPPHLRPRQTAADGMLQQLQAQARHREEPKDSGVLSLNATVEQGGGARPCLTLRIFGGNLAGAVREARQARKDAFDAAMDAARAECDNSEPFARLRRLSQQEADTAAAVEAARTARASAMADARRVLAAGKDPSALERAARQAEQDMQTHATRLGLVREWVGQAEKDAAEAMLKAEGNCRARFRAEHEQSEEAACAEFLRQVEPLLGQLIKGYGEVTFVDRGALR